MVNGYTACIESGNATFPDFIRRCAHAFVRYGEPDHPEEIELVTSENPYYLTKLTSLKSSLESIENMNERIAEIKAIEYYNKKVKEQNDYIRNQNELRIRYINMLDKVKEWKVPKELEDMRAFMIQQIEQSIKHDCTPHPFDTILIEKKTGVEWKECAIEKYKESIKYYTKERKEEQKRNAIRNKFVKILFENIPEDI